MIVLSYYTMLKRYKLQFIKSELHLRNEASVTEVIHKIAEPVLIIKKNKRLSKPKF